MNVVAYASLAFLIVSILACSFVAYRVRPRSYKAGDTLPVLSYIILLDEIASVVIAFVSLTWMKSVPWYPIIVYLAIINFFFSFISFFATLLPQEPMAVPKYLW